MGRKQEIKTNPDGSLSVRTIETGGVDPAFIEEVQGGMDELKQGKADKTEVRLKKDQLKQTDLSEELLQQMAGNTPINAVPADNSLTVEKMKFLSVVKTNLHNPATDTNGQYINGSGGLGANASWKASDYIAIVVGKKYTNSSGLQSAYYDAAKKFLSMVTFDGKSYTPPVGAAFVRHSYSQNEIGVLCEGDVLLDPQAPYDSNKVVVIDKGYKESIAEISRGAIVLTEGKSALFFGDSITQEDNIADDFSTHVVGWKTNWPTYVRKELKLGTTWNYGKDGASYRDRAGLVSSQKITKQIEEAVNKKRPADIIIVSAGTNDGPTDLGDFDTAMSKTKLEELDKTKLYEAIRWSFWTLRLNYPNAICYTGLPLQRMGGYSTTYVEPLLTAIKKMAREYNFIVIDAFGESGIVREFEKYQSAGRLLADGLHPNELGKKVLANLYIKRILETYLPYPV